MVRAVSLVFKHLTPEDLRSRTWEHFVEEMQARIAELRIENDSFSDHDTTTKRRGRLAEIKGWLDLAQQAQRSDGSPQGLQSFRPPSSGF
jgi:23S rRNA maturation mini-RNase III